MWTVAPNPAMPRPARAVYATVALAAAALLATAMVSVFLTLINPARSDIFLPGLVPFESPWHATGAALFALAFFALGTFGFVFEWRRQSTTVTLDEVALFLGTLFLPGSSLILGVAVATAATQLRQRRAPVKALFNVALYTVGTGFAVLGVRLVRSLGVSEPYASLPAPIVFAIATAWLLSALFSRLEGASLASTFRQRVDRWAVPGGTIGSSLGLVLYALYSLTPLAVLAAVPVFFYLRTFGRLSEWADAELRTHQRLAAVAAEVAGVSDLDAVADRILASCKDLFDCGEAQLSLKLPGSPPRTWRRSFAVASAGIGGVRGAITGTAGEAYGEITVFPRHGQRAFGEREHHLLRTVAGTASASVANARAVAAARTASRERQATELRYRELFERSTSFIHVLDVEGHIVDANPSARRFLPDVEGSPLLDFVSPADRGRFSTALACLIEDGVLDNLEVRLVGEGSEIVALVDGRRIEIAGEPPRFVLISRDVTALKTLEAAQRETIRRLENMNRELEEFTLWTTHDMREPLRSVGTLAKILHDEFDALPRGEAKDLARRILAGSDGLKERIKALHEFSRVVQGDAAFDTVGLDDVLADAARGLEARIAERAAVVRRLRPLPVARVQRHRFEKVFANLLENALKHNDKPEPVIEVTWRDAGEEIEVSVRDNGPGVQPAYHERIFQLFQRGTSSREGGSGAGLAIVKRIVEQHGGRVWVERRPGPGADFRFTLPKPPAAVAPAAPTVRIVAEEVPLPPPADAVSASG